MSLWHGPPSTRVTAERVVMKCRYPVGCLAAHPSGRCPPSLEDCLWKCPYRRPARICSSALVSHVRWFACALNFASGLVDFLFACFRAFRLPYPEVGWGRDVFENSLLVIEVSP